MLAATRELSPGLEHQETTRLYEQPLEGEAHHSQPVRRGTWLACLHLAELTELKHQLIGAHLYRRVSTAAETKPRKTFTP